MFRIFLVHKCLLLVTWKSTASGTKPQLQAEANGRTFDIVAEEDSKHESLEEVGGVGSLYPKRKKLMLNPNPECPKCTEILT